MLRSERNVLDDMKRIVIAAIVMGLALGWMAISSKHTSPVGSTESESSGDEQADAVKSASGYSPRMRPVRAPRPMPPPSLVEAVREGLNSSNVAVHEMAINRLFDQLIQDDPAAAAGLAVAMPEGAEREDMLRRVAQGWAAADAAKAIEWAAQLSQPAEKNSALTDVALQISRTDPASAINVVEQYGLGSLGTGLVETIVEQWAEWDLTSALAWANARPAGTQRDEIMSRIAYVQLQTEPQAAANLVVSEIPEGIAQEEAAMTVLYEWTLQDPDEAVAWMELLPDGSFRERALAELAGEQGLETPLDETSLSAQADQPQ